jgi:hypothetical protein
MLFRTCCLALLFACYAALANAQIIEVKNQFVAGDVDASTGILTIKYVVNGKAKGYLTNPGHSFLSLSINGQWFTNNNVGGQNLVGILGGSGSPVTPFPLDGGVTKVLSDTIQTTFSEGGGKFDIVQEVYPVAFPGRGQIVWRVKIVNHSNSALSVEGLQYLNDLQAGTNDNPYLVERNYFDGKQWRVSSKDGTNPNPPSLYVEIDQDTFTSQINLMGVGYTNDSFPPSPLGLTPCLAFAAGSWQGPAQYQMLNYIYGCPAPPSPNTTSDMACVLQWPARNVPAAAQGRDTSVEEFRTSFGTFGSSCTSGFIDLDFMPQSITYNSSLKTFSPNPFNVLALRINLSDSSATNVFDTEVCLTHNLSGTGVRPSNGIGRNVPRLGFSDFLWRDSVISYDTTIWIQFHEYAEGLNVRDLSCGSIIPVLWEGSGPSTHILSRSGSYDGSACNARVTQLRAYDTGTGRSTIFVRPDSAQNMTVSIPKLIADTISYTVSVMDSMFDGFAYVSIRDTLGNVTYDTVRYCTIADKADPVFHPILNGKSSLGGVLTDTAAWDRGVSTEMTVDTIGPGPLRLVVDTTNCKSGCCSHLALNVQPLDSAKEVICSVYVKDCAGNKLSLLLEYSPFAIVAASSNNAVIYPNPSYDAITITLGDETPQHATLQNLLGRVVAQSTIRGTGELDISTLAPGTYILRVAGVTRKIIKE